MTTATDIGCIEMRIAKVVGLGAAEDEPVHQYVVLDGVAGNRHLAIAIGQPEAFSLAARLAPADDLPVRRRPGASAWGRVRQVQIDRVVEETYIATVEVEGPPGTQSVDARPSDALNLAALVQAPIFVAPEVLQEVEARPAGVSLKRHACVGRWQLRR